MQPFTLGFPFSFFSRRTLPFLFPLFLFISLYISFFLSFREQKKKKKKKIYPFVEFGYNPPQEYFLVRHGRVRQGGRLHRPIICSQHCFKKKKKKKKEENVQKKKEKLKLLFFFIYVVLLLFLSWGRLIRCKDNSRLTKYLWYLINTAHDERLQWKHYRISYLKTFCVHVYFLHNKSKIDFYLFFFIYLVLFSRVFFTHSPFFCYFSRSRPCFVTVVK